MSDVIPRTVSRTLQFDNGSAIGISNRWNQGQYCSILTPAEETDQKPRDSVDSPGSSSSE